MQLLLGFADADGTELGYDENGAPYIIEQAAFSYYMPQFYTIITSQKDIHHYWYFKEFRIILNLFFEKNKTNSTTILLEKLKNINPEVLGYEKSTYKKMTFWQRTFKKITTFQKWKIPEVTY